MQRRPRTELFFRQAVGRFVRWIGGLTSQKAYVYIPDDPRLRAHAFQIADQRRHSLRRRDEDEDLDGFRRNTDEELDALTEEGDPEQLSLFSMHSAVVTDVTVHSVGAEWEDEPDPDEPTEDLDAFLVDLEPLPLPAGGLVGGLPGESRREMRARLRDANADLAKTLVGRTGWSHSKVNAELNRLAGVTRVTEATVDQLERRLRYGESWLRKARPSR